MKSNDLKDLIEKARQAPRPSRPDVPEIPEGFANRVIPDLPVRESSSTLRLLEWASYAGVAAAAGIAVVASLQTAEPKASDELAVDPWLDMPMALDLKENTI